MHKSTDTVEDIGNRLIFKIYSKYMGLLDDIAFTLLIHFPLLGSMYFAAVISAQLHDPFPSHHFNEKYMYVHNVFLDACCARPCGTLWGFLSALWTNYVKNIYNKVKDYVSFHNSPSQRSEMQRPTRTKSFYGHKQS